MPCTDCSGKCVKIPGQDTIPEGAAVKSYPVADKWRSFGWHTIELDGHKIPVLQAAFKEASNTKGKPTAIIAHTIKGKGVSFMENNPKFHGTAPTPDEVQRALQELQ